MNTLNSCNCDKYHREKKFRMSGDDLTWLGVGQVWAMLLWGRIPMKPESREEYLRGKMMTTVEEHHIPRPCSRRVVTFTGSKGSAVTLILKSKMKGLGRWSLVSLNSEDLRLLKSMGNH